jgi:hypothetical protein
MLLTCIGKLANGQYIPVSCQKCRKLESHCGREHTQKRLQEQAKYISLRSRRRRDRKNVCSGFRTVFRRQTRLLSTYGVRKIVCYLRVPKWGPDGSPRQWDLALLIWLARFFLRHCRVEWIEKRPTDVQPLLWEGGNWDKKFSHFFCFSSANIYCSFPCVNIVINRHLL